MNKPVAEVVSFTNGSCGRNYKLRWLGDAPEGAKLYADPPESAAILSRLRDDSAAGRFKTVEEFRSWVLGVDTL